LAEKDIPIQDSIDIKQVHTKKVFTTGKNSGQAL